MGRFLSQKQIESYRRDNFLSPIHALTTDEVQRYLRGFESYEEKLGGGPLRAWQLRKLHVRETWAAELIRHPRVLNAVEDLIGPDILVFNATFFIKEARGVQVTAWHQDATYFGLQPHLHVSAWIALTDAPESAGCMRFVPGSSAQGQLYHDSESVADSVNHGQQYIAETFDDSASCCAPLHAGQFSLHHTLVIHSSAPNTTDVRRIGFGVSYIPAGVVHGGTQPMGATLVRGTDESGNFDLEPDPRQFDLATNASNHARAYASYRRGYDEQIIKHRKRYARVGVRTSNG